MVVVGELRCCSFLTVGDEAWRGEAADAVCCDLRVDPVSARTLCREAEIVGTGDGYGYWADKGGGQVGGHDRTRQSGNEKTNEAPGRELERTKWKRWSGRGRVGEAQMNTEDGRRWLSMLTSGPAASSY